MDTPEIREAKLKAFNALFEQHAASVRTLFKEEKPAQWKQLVDAWNDFARLKKELNHAPVETLPAPQRERYDELWKKINEVAVHIKPALDALATQVTAQADLSQGPQTEHNGVLLPDYSNPEERELYAASVAGEARLALHTEARNSANAALNG